MFKSKCPKCRCSFRNPRYKYHKEHFKWNELPSGDIHCPECGVKLDTSYKSINPKRIVAILIILVLGFTYLGPDNPFYLSNSIFVAVVVFLLFIYIALPDKYIIKE